MFWLIVGVGLALCLLGIVHAYSLSLSVGGANKLLASWTSDNPIEVNYDDTLAIGTDVAIGVALDISQLRSFVFLASTDATLKTNASGAPQETITLEGGVPLQWDSRNTVVPIATYFGGDVTEIFVTNAAECDLQIFTGQAS